MKKYEAMFLFDPAVTPDWDAAKAELTRIMDRAGARVIVANKWDERRLAYEIRGRKRAIYGLTFFEAEASKIGEMERDVRLSEAILRCLILQADHLSQEEIMEIASRPADHSLAEAERIGGRSGGYRSGPERDRDRDRDRDRRGPRRDESEAPLDAEAVKAGDERPEE